MRLPKLKLELFEAMDVLQPNRVRNQTVLGHVPIFIALQRLTRRTQSRPDSEVYKPLIGEQIRILVLHPGRYKNVIDVSLVTEQLCDSGPRPYEAVSYAWGHLQMSHAIRCDGSEVRVTENLDRLLRHLRRKTQTRRLWIDALCINQLDFSERNHQVNRMRWIYTNAKQVLIWTGKEDNYTDEVVTWLSKWQPGSPEPPPWAFYEKLDGSDAVTRFLDRPWFHRAWTFQEACLASDAKVMCGNVQFPWAYITNAALALEAKSLAQNVLASAADSLLALARFAVTTDDTEKKQPELLDLLRLTRGLQATDPRDKVFALLGMLTDLTNPGIEPDYFSQVTTADVYTQCARLIIARDGSLEILSSSLGPLQGTDLPTWVPDWRLPRQTAILRSFEWPAQDSPFYQVNKSCPLSNYMSKIDSSSRRLSLHGIHLATVTSIHSATAFITKLLSEHPFSYNAQSRWNDFEPEFRRLFISMGFRLPDNYRQTGESALMAFFRTLFADRLPKPEEMSEFIRSMMKKVRSVPSYLTSTPEPGDRPIYSDIWLSQAGGLNLAKIRGPPIPSRWITKLQALDTNVSEQTDKYAHDMQQVQTFLHICDMALNILDYPLYSAGGGSAQAVIPGRQQLFNHDEAYKMVDKISSAIWTFMSNRVLFKTDNGLIGIGPDYMDEGDQVWDLFGGDVPYILRQSGSSERTQGDAEYSLVGECYVHGIMKGELWDAPSSSTNSSSLRGENLKVEKIELV